MTETLLVFLSLMVVVLLVFVIILSRRRTAPVDEDRLRRLLDQALTAHTPASGIVAAGRHADGDAVSAETAAEVQRAYRDLAAGRQRVARADADADSARADAVTARNDADSARNDADSARNDAKAARVEIESARAETETVRAEVNADRAQAQVADQGVTESAQLAARELAAAEVADALAEIDRQRVALAEERHRLVTETTAAVAAERTDLQTAQQRLQASMEALAEDQRRLAADRERTRGDESEVGRMWAKVTGKEQLLQLEAEQLAARQDELAERRRAVEEHALTAEVELVRISGLTADAARAELMSRQEDLARRDSAMMVRRIESEAQASAKQRARAIVADAIQRVASDQTAQTVVSVVHLPADEVKGRIIGREGRNIRAFETVTGVNVIIDDTPEAVLLSCFDPVRREIGRITLEMLIEDGRIHPHRIEEAYDRAHDEVEARCARAAEDAMLDVGVSDLHPELVKLLGHLKYRTSYGQNVLGHLVESAHIAGGMAAELGVDPKPVIRGAFLHDIGKALTHEAQGSHAMVGAELARRYGEGDEVAHCIEAHHDEVPPSTVEAVLTQAADACSGGRPGARRESMESYVQRLERIESIAAGKRGVEKVFAMQAGRELRVMVKPDVLDDLEAHLLAREVAKQIEEELTYPGQVRVTVVRESRATEVAR